jgi:hypothetical protein
MRRKREEGESGAEGIWVKAFPDSGLKFDSGLRWNLTKKKEAS